MEYQKWGPSVGSGVAPSCVNEIIPGMASGFPFPTIRSPIAGFSLQWLDRHHLLLRDKHWLSSGDAHSHGHVYSGGCLFLHRP